MLMLRNDEPKIGKKIYKYLFHFLSLSHSHTHTHTFIFYSSAFNEF